MKNIKDALRWIVENKGVEVYQNDALLNGMLADLSKNEEKERQKMRSVLSFGAGKLFYKLFLRSNGNLKKSDINEFKQHLADYGFASDFSMQILNTFLYSVGNSSIPSDDKSGTEIAVASAKDDEDRKDLSVEPEEAKRNNYKPAQLVTNKKTIASNNKISKGKKAAVLTAMIIVLAVVAILFFSIDYFKSKSDSIGGWGPERETFTIDRPADYAIFNSITDNPEIGDERNFVRIREIGKDSSYTDKVTVTPGKEYEVYIYYNNNAGEDTNPTGFGMATNTRISSSYPVNLTKGEIGTITANLSWSFVTPDNPNDPQTGQVWDTAFFETDYDNVVLRFKAASATIHNDGEANGSVLPSHIFTQDGTPIGYNKLAGTIPGGSKYSGYITYTLVAEKTETPGGWGPERETFTNAEPAGYATFNSITDNAAVGDERAFVRIREVNEDSKFTASIGKAFLVEPGKEYEIYIYYHNNAASNTNETGKGVATGVKCSTTFTYKIQKGTFGYVNAKITATDTNPQEVWSEVALFANEDVSIKFVENSAVIHNGWQTNGMILVPDKLFGDGVFLGVDSLNGVVFGCAEYSGYVTYRIKVSKEGEFTQSWGPQDRETFTWANPADHAVFNSITDNPALGDERNFVRVREAGVDTPYGDYVDAIAGKDYEIYIYYHNNASSALDPTATAKGVALQVAMPERVTAGQTAVIKGTISSENAEPSEVWDTAFLTAQENIRFSVVPNSAVLHSFGETDGDLLDLNAIFGDGATFSPNKSTPGEVPYTEEGSRGYITLRVKAEAIDD